MPPLLCQAPLELHVWGCCPLHCVVPGTQTPVHAPATQAWPVHADAVPHWPVESQVWTPLLLVHCRAPGAQAPVQAPETHAWLVHRVGVPQTPAEPQTCTLSFGPHCVAPGVQAAQAPATQTGVPPLHALAVLQLPVASHVWTPLPEQRVAPGVHTPEQQALAPPSHPVVPHTKGQPVKLPH